MIRLSFAGRVSIGAGIKFQRFTALVRVKADPEAGQQAPDRILHIHARFDRNFARPQQSSALLGNTAFDLDALVKSCAGKLRQHGSIVLIGFIVHLAQYGMRLTRINADHRQTALAEFVVKPIRHPAGFQNDAPNVLQVTEALVQRSATGHHLVFDGSLIWLLRSRLGNERISGARRRAFG